MAAERKEIEEKFELRLQTEVAVAAQRIAQAEAQAAKQWQELTLKVLEHRFQSVPVALVLLLSSVEPNQRSRVTDIILEADNLNECLQQIRQLVEAK